MFWRSVGRFGSNRPVRVGVDVKNINHISLFLVCLHQSIRSCSHLMLIQAFCIGDFFSCVLKIELQSTRVHMYEIKKKFQKNELHGWYWTLMDSKKLVLVSWSLASWSSSFSWSRLGGAMLAEVCLRLEADWSKSGWTDIITFFIGGDPLQKSISGAVGRKWNGSPLLVIGSGPSCWCQQGEQD